MPATARVSKPPWRYSSKYWEPEASLLHYELRSYSPTLGRWLSKDPLGELGGLNLYEFVGNSTLNDWDLLGLYGPLGPGFIDYGQSTGGSGSSGYYGNYGGGYWTNGRPDPDSQTPSDRVGPPFGPPPVDDLDDAYRQHDICHKKCNEDWPILPGCTLDGKSTDDIHKEARKSCKRECDRQNIEDAKKAQEGRGPTGNPGSIWHAFWSNFIFNFTNR